MLYILLLLVVVLIIALVLKKRSATQAEPKSTLKGAAKKGAAAKAATKTKLVEEPIIKKQETTPLDAGLRSQIEALIQEKNYSSAEAKINTALNQDNSQHELYLLLLDIHVFQKDEFAIGQLLNHLRSLELEDIVAQAELREAEFKSSLHQVKDTIDYPIEEAPATPIESTKSDFSKKVDTLAFDQLQGNDVKAAEPIVEIETLEFNFQPATQTTAQPVQTADEVVEIAADRTLEFGRVDIEVPAPEVTTLNAEDFSQFELNTETTAPKVQETAQDIPPVELDFSEFNLTSEAVEEKPVETQADTQAIALDFTSFTTTDEATVEETTETAAPLKEQPIETLDFSFSQPEVSLRPDEPETVVESPISNDLDFNFTITDAPAVETPRVEPTFGTEPNLDFNLLGESTPAPIATPVSPALTESVDESDPLVQAFPELVEQSEAELNLVLATQYIQLGAFDAARELLDEVQDQFNQSQQQRAQELRNQLA